MSQQWLSKDLNKIESKVVWQISFKACWASVLQLVAVKSWQRSFFLCFSLKKKKWSQKTTVANGNESMGPSHKEVGTKTPQCALLKAFLKKMLHRSHPAEHSVWAQIHVYRVTNLEDFPVWITMDEAPMPLPVLEPLFISPLSFHLSWALLGAWRFGLFHCIYSSFHNRLDLIRELAFNWVFYFPNLSVFVSSYVKMKKFCLF